MRLGKLTFIPALVLLGSSLAASAQSSTSAPFTAPPERDVPGIQTLHVTSREVIVDVIVTDGKGNPVHGLQQSSFTLFENGHPQSIRSFREVTSNPPPEPPASRLQPGVYTNSHSMPSTGPVNILLIDSLNGGAALYMVQQISDYLQKMSRGTQIAIFWLSATGLHTLQPFTSDPETLRNALVAQTQNIDLERLDLASYIGPWTRQRITAQGFNQIAAYVAGIRGRKNLFWFTRGLPINLMRDGGYSWIDGPADMDLVHRLMDTYELLTAADVAVYPVNQGINQMSFATLRLEQVAEQSGGEAIYGTNDITPAIAKAIDKGSQFYSISYIPPRQTDDGHYHKIKVELDQPDLHLVYRKGYNAERLPTVNNPSPGPELMKASMERNAPPATGLLFDAAVQPVPLIGSLSKPTPPQPKKVSKIVHRIYPYQVTYGFPGSEVTFTEDEYQKLHGKLEFDVVAYDVKQVRVAELTQTVDLPLTIDQFDDFAAAPYRFTQTIDLPPGPLSLHVGIIDTVSNKVGTLEIPVNIGNGPRPISASLRKVPAPCDPRCPIAPTW